MDLTFEFDGALIGSHLLRLFAAFVLALPIGWDREREGRTLGLRTLPLVALASAGYVLIAASVVDDDGGAMARVLQGLMTGVGFLGGGAIVKQGLDVRGAATAASIWATAAMGAAVALGRFEVALAITLTTFAVLRWMAPLKPIVNGQDDEPADD